MGSVLLQVWFLNSFVLYDWHSVYILQSKKNANWDEYNRILLIETTTWLWYVHVQTGQEP